MKKDGDWEGIVTEACNLAFPALSHGDDDGKGLQLTIYDYREATANRTNYVSLRLDGATYSWTPDGFFRNHVLIFSGCGGMPVDDDGWRDLKSALDATSADVRRALAKMESHILRQFQPLQFSYIHGLYIWQDVKVTEKVQVHVTYEYSLVEKSPVGPPVEHPYDA